jgi:hypothetical protein
MKSDIHFPKNMLKDLINKYEQLGKKFNLQETYIKLYHIINNNDLNQYLFDLSHFILKSISPSPFL